jgi:hypothetical protein
LPHVGQSYDFLKFVVSAAADKKLFFCSTSSQQDTYSALSKLTIGLGKDPALLTQKIR